MTPRTKTRTVPSVPNGKAGYHVFVLRLWREDATNATWRASLDDPSVDDRRGFADVETLAAFLRSLCSAPGSDSQMPPGGRGEPPQDR
jgi:hypothetical protein